MNIFKDNNDWNEKSIIGFIAFAIMCVIMIADLVTGYVGKDLIITAETKDKIIMGIMHKKYNVHGVQFHPESIKTPEGIKLLKNFLNNN